jgi:hypothetical protein
MLTMKKTMKKAMKTMMKTKKTKKTANAKRQRAGARVYRHRAESSQHNTIKNYSFFNHRKVGSREARPLRYNSIERAIWRALLLTCSSLAL